MNPASNTWPAILYGTAWKKDASAALTRQAITAGYRAIDTANQPQHYSETGVGEGITAAMNELGLERGDLFLQTKFTPLDGHGSEIPYDPQAPIGEQVEQSLQASLEHLNTDYLDSYLLHGPYHPRRMSEADWEAWSALETIQERGTALRIGISNIAAGHLYDLLSGATVPPMTVQNRCFARSGWDRNVREVCAKHDIAYQGFSLLTANPFMLKDATVLELAGTHDATPEQIVFAFARQVGMIPLTGTTDAQHMTDDLEALAIRLDADAAATIEQIAG
ncbi:MAG: aldo/keto reductase [Gammaproteobacteria bacterium]|nr:aldo/keto reductase [Gammaproteobacteria bacterium]